MCRLPGNVYPFVWENVGSTAGIGYSKTGVWFIYPTRRTQYGKNVVVTDIDDIYHRSCQLVESPRSMCEVSALL